MNILETTKHRSIKIYYQVAFDGLYILTGNVATSYFQSAANRINVSILGHVWAAISP